MILGSAYFVPTIIKILGHTSIRANILSAPPWAAAFVFAMTMAIFSDSLAHRFLFAIIITSIGMAGFIILVIPNLPSLTYYMSIFLAIAGTYAAMPITICWLLANLGGHTKRSVGSAWQIGFGNIGGIIVTYVFLPERAPRFVLERAFVLLVWLCVLFLVVFIMLAVWWNKRRDRSEVQGHRKSERELRRKGDEHPNFRFIL
jgi:Na+/melibiose symporter-like transporter